MVMRKTARMPERLIVKTTLIPATLFLAIPPTVRFEMTRLESE